MSLKKNKKGLFVVISAPSGAGKTTIVKELGKQSARIKRSISATTRERRRGERNGKDYFFMKKKDFFSKRKKGCFLEWANVFGEYYGTPKAFILRELNKGFDVVLTIDIQGAAKVRRQFKEAVLIFVVPPSLAVLKKRIVKRGTDSRKEIDKRLQQAKKELRAALTYDFIVVNKSVNTAVATIQSILTAEKTKTERNKEVIHGIYSTRKNG